jgi:hypothetical protein
MEGCSVVHLHNGYLSSHSFRSISALVTWIPMVNRESQGTGEAMDGMGVDICFVFWVDIAIIRSSSRADGMPELLSSYWLSSWRRWGTHMTTHREISWCYWMECAPRAVRMRFLLHHTDRRKNRARPAKLRIRDMNRSVLDNVSQLLSCGEYNGWKTGNACSNIDRNDSMATENPLPAVLPEVCRQE